MNEAQALIEELRSYGASQVLIAKLTNTTTVNISRIVHGERSGNWTLPRLRYWVMRTRKAREEQARQQQQQQIKSMIVSQPAPAPVRQVARPQVVESRPIQIIQQVQAAPARRFQPDLLPQRAASMQSDQAPPDVILSPIAYHAHYRPETWPIGVPVHPPPELKVKLAWPRTPERWNQ